VHPFFGVRRTRHYGYFSALLLTCVATVELTLVATGHAWTRLSERNEHIVMVPLAIFLLTTAAAILLRARGPHFALAAWILSITSTLALVLHSLVFLAWPYLPVAALLAYLLVRLFSGEWDALRALSRGVRRHA
jgi:hypothetical protein